MHLGLVTPKAVKKTTYQYYVTQKYKNTKMPSYCKVHAAPSTSTEGNRRAIFPAGADLRNKLLGNLMVERNLSHPEQSATLLLISVITTTIIIAAHLRWWITSCTRHLRRSLRRSAWGSRFLSCCHRTPPMSSREEHQHQQQQQQQQQQQHSSVTRATEGEVLHYFIVRGSTWVPWDYRPAPRALNARCAFRAQATWQKIKDRTSAGYKTVSYTDTHTSSRLETRVIT